MINLGEADDPYLIFESLNYKGVPLTQADLVRNYVLMKYKHSLGSGGEQERVYRQLWQPLENATGDNLSEFLRHYGSMTGQNVKKPQVYATIKASITDLSPDRLEVKLAEMRDYAAHYQKVIDPNTEPEASVRGRLRNLIDIEVSVCYPLLIQMLDSYSRRHLSAAELCECVDMIASFVVRRAACEILRGPMNKLFIRFAGKYPSTGDVVSWFRDELLKGERSERWPDNEEFSKALRVNQLYGTKPARVILEGLEAHAAGKERCITDDLTIEHIMPQELSDEWSRNLGPDANLIHKQFLHTLGNLTLTGYNSELGNSSFAAKLKFFRDSNLSLNKPIVLESEWGRTQIEYRAAQLASTAVSIWWRPA